jgi:hypothetical protein
MKIALSLLALALAPAASFGAVLLEYTGGATGSPTTAPTATSPLISSGTSLFFSTKDSALTSPTQDGDGAITRGDTIVNQNGAAASYNIFQISPTNRTDYIQFTLTPNASGVDLQTISFDAARLGTASNRSLQVVYSFGSTFDAPSATSASPVVTLASGAHTYDRYSFALQDQNQAGQITSGPVTFRLNATVTPDTRSIGFDNITVSGIAATAVPEPTGLAAVGSIMAITACFARRRRA